MLAQQVQAILTEQEALRRTATDAKREAVVAKQHTIELTSTVAAQKKRLQQSERTIRELLQALKGKKRERLDSNQLLLFDLGELEQLLEEAAKSDDSASAKAGRRRQKHGRRIIPDNLPTEEVLYELPEEQRLCPIDGKPMPANASERAMRPVAIGRKNWSLLGACLPAAVLPS